MDKLTKEQRRKNMQAVKCKNTKIETTLAKALWSKGLRYRRNYTKIDGKPDIVFVKKRVAVFCDGDYWHGKDWETAKKQIKSNREFWYKKIEGNMERDRKVNRLLKEKGWTVLRFWGSEIKKNLDDCVRKVEDVVNSPSLYGKKDGRKYPVDYKDALIAAEPERPSYFSDSEGKHSS